MVSQLINYPFQGSLTPVDSNLKQYCYSMSAKRQFIFQNNFMIKKDHFSNCGLYCLLFWFEFLIWHKKISGFVHRQLTGNMLRFVQCLFFICLMIVDWFWTLVVVCIGRKDFFQRCVTVIASGDENGEKTPNVIYEWAQSRLYTVVLFGWC